MYFDLKDGQLITTPEVPTGCSPTLTEALHGLARECILLAVIDGDRPTTIPDEADYDLAIEALGVKWRDTDRGSKDEAWPKAEFRRAYEAEFLRAELRAAAKLGARQDRMMARLQAAECWHVTLVTTGPDLIRLAFEDEADELEAALNEQEQDEDVSGLLGMRAQHQQEIRAELTSSPLPGTGSPLRQALFPKSKGAGQWSPSSALSDDVTAAAVLEAPRTPEMKRDLFSLVEGVGGAEFVRRVRGTVIPDPGEDEIERARRLPSIPPEPSLNDPTHELPGIYPNIIGALVGLVRAPWKWENPIEGVVRLRCRVLNPDPPQQVRVQREVMTPGSPLTVFTFEACSAYEPPVPGDPIKITVAYRVTLK